MVFSNDDLAAAIKISFEEKGFRGKRIVDEYRVKTGQDKA